LKLDNVVLMRRDSLEPVKLIDFGVAKELGTATATGTVIGTWHYLAPEIARVEAGLVDRYTPICDVWSCGVVLYMLLCGEFPFYEERRVDGKQLSVAQQVLLGTYDMSAPCWSNISSDAKDLVRAMMNVDPKQRINAKQALEHPFLRLGNNDNDNDVDDDDEPSIDPNASQDASQDVSQDADSSCTTQ
jgi:serine/threonine protein kinase